MPDSDQDAAAILLLLERLERIPADSPWAHRASGVRGALLRLLEEHVTRADGSPAAESAIAAAFQILRNAAAERIRYAHFRRQA